METAALTPSLAQLRARLPGVMLRDQRRLSRHAGQAAGLRDAGAREAVDKRAGQPRKLT